MGGSAEPIPLRRRVPVGAGGRLAGVADRAATTSRADAIAGFIRQHQGNVWPACREFGISYPHACRIRAGWREGGRRAAPIPYRTRGWMNGRRNGWTGQEDARG